MDIWMDSKARSTYESRWLKYKIDNHNFKMKIYTSNYNLQILYYLEMKKNGEHKVDGSNIITKLKYIVYHVF